MRLRARRLGGLFATAVTGILVAGLVAQGAVAGAADRSVVLDHGHIDGFEVTYHAGTSAMRLMIKDDTRIHDAGVVYRSPGDVTIAYDDTRAIQTLPPAEGQWAFLGPYGGTNAWMSDQGGGDQTYLPWVGWSTERLASSLSGTGIEPAAGTPVSLDVAIQGPGDVFTFMNDAFGAPINRYVDTLAGGTNTIPVAAHAHVHTNWIYTAAGDYCLTVTPRLATVGHGTITGPSASYHVRVGPSTGGGGVACSGGQPDPIDPEPTDPEPTDPEPTEPEPEPEPTDPDATDPEPIAVDDASDAAVMISQERFPSGGALPPFAVLARDDVFADTLAASALTGSAPLLFTADDGLSEDAASELQRLLPNGGTVYLMGGENALTPAVADQVRKLGLQVQRLAGDSRIETALAVADEVMALGGGGQVLIARAFGTEGNPTSAWVDSVAVGTWAAHTGQPVILTQTDGVHPAVEAWLAERPDVPRVLIGGEAALSAEVQAATGASRVAGDNRYASAVAIAQQLWGSTAREYMVTAADRGDGWAFGLAAAGLGADDRAPLLMVETNRLPDETDQALSCDDGRRPSVRVIGGPSVVSDSVVDALAAC